MIPDLLLFEQYLVAIESKPDPHEELWRIEDVFFGLTSVFCYSHQLQQQPASFLQSDLKISKKLYFWRVF